MNSYEIGSDKIAKVTFRHIKGLNEVTEVFDRLFGDKDFVQSTGLLVDLSDNQDLEFDLHDVEQLVTFFKSHRNKLEQRKFAVLAVDDHAYGISRMWETMKNFQININSCVFRDRNKAIAWLDT